MGKEGKPKPGGKVVTDSRFAAVHYDPRFQRFPKAKSKVEIDERFAGMFKDAAFQVRSTVDKRGRKVRGSKKNEDMRRYYRLKGEEEGEGQQREEEQGEQDKDIQRKQAAKAAVSSRAAQAKSDEGAAGSIGEDEARLQGSDEPADCDSEFESESESGSELEDEERAAKERWARMRGLAGPESSSEEEEEEDDEEEEDESDEDDDAKEDGEEEGMFRQQGPPPAAAGEEEEPLNEADLQEWGVGALAANPEEPIPLLPDATPRLAAVDLDWEHVRAVDILAVLRSFVPKGGAVRSVVVYPSDYGLERMAKEAVAGPQGIFKPAPAASKKGQPAAEGGEEGGPDAEDGSDAGSGSDSEDGGEVDKRRLRLYERSKLRYYYAIITCDSAATANQLYEECDGMEFMKTACKFDLRFVPEEQSFEGRQVRDKAGEVPSDYVPPTFQTRALQHTNVQLTWDADDEGRKRALTRRMNADELKEDDFKAYLATDSEDESEEEEDGGAGSDGDDEEAIRERYRCLLLGGGDAAKERQGKKDWGACDADEGGSEDGDSEEGSGEDGEEAAGTRVKDDKGMEMEVTFLPGLENLGERLLARKREEEGRKGETVWEAYMRRKREKRAEAKRKGRRLALDESDSDYDDGAVGSGSDEDLPAGVEDDPFFQREEDPFDDPFFKDGPDADAAEAAELAGGGKQGRRQKQQQQQQEKQKGKKGKGKKSEQEEAADPAKKAELEMLLMDDAALMAAARGGGAGALVPGGTQQGDGQEGGGAAKLSKKERMRLKKEARRRERQEGSDDEDAAAGGGAAFSGVDLSDPRFAELLTSHHFALDPTDPRFKDTSASVAAEVAKKRSAAASSKQQQQQGKAGRATAGGQDGNPAAATAAGKSAKADLKLLVASLKRKSAQKEQQAQGNKQPAAAAAAGGQDGSRKKKKQRV